VGERKKIRMEKISIQENFLAEEEFVKLRDTIAHFEFPWHFSLEVVNKAEKKPSPGIFFHTIYYNKTPCSPLYNLHFLPIMEALDVAVLLHIRVNLNTRLLEPYLSDFHTDTKKEIRKDSIASQWMTSVFYINTNNGYTELEDGTIVESVANRLASFPANTEHRVVTQTDEPARYVINFNYY